MKATREELLQEAVAQMRLFCNGIAARNERHDRVEWVNHEHTE